MIGAITFASGWPAAWMLLLFFFSSSLLGRLTRTLRAAGTLAEEQAAPRGATQVMAVGLVPAAAAFCVLFTGEARWLWGMAGALAFATSDTWSTDWGQTFPGLPRWLGFGRNVEPGQSGGMTLRGTLAGALGALFLACAGTVALRGTLRQALLVAGVAWGGSLLDSVLGALAQWRGTCVVCGRLTERRRHCGARALTLRPGLSNEGVNLVCSALCLWLGTLAAA